MSSTKTNKWNSLQAVLAQEEDREQAERDRSKARDQEASVSPVPQTSLATQTDPIQALRVPSETSLAKIQAIGWSETSLASETNLAPKANLKVLEDGKQYGLMAGVPEVKGYNKQYYELIDHLYPLLDSYEQVIHSHLFRLSWGFNKSTCIISLPTLAKRGGMSVKSAQRTINRLEDKGLVEKLRMVLGKGREQGVEFRIAPPPSLARETSLAGKPSLAPQTTNKEHTLKETHTNTDGVRVSSRFTLQECKKFAESLRAEGITNPGGYATKIHRSGEADDLIAGFLNPGVIPQAVDTTQCPDCHGTGFWEPGGTGKGVAKCRHEQLLSKTE
jgi:hypothetical protein